jgi:CMP-N-acetylneuraminic acid synthetase
MSKKIIALLPMRHESERVPGKNYRDFNGRPLFHYIVDTLLECSLISEVVIDTDSPVIMEDAKKNFPSVRLIERSKELLGGDVPMNDILLHDVTMVNADLYLQTHSTNPLLKSETITRAIEGFLENSDKYDSLFSVTAVRTRFWDKHGKAINHDPSKLIRTQDLEPIYEENSNIYIYSKKVLEDGGSRIGERPMIFEIDRLEAMDIDEELDFQVAEVLYKKTRGAGI